MAIPFPSATFRVSGAFRHSKSRSFSSASHVDCVPILSQSVESPPAAPAASMAAHRRALGFPAAAPRATAAARAAPQPRAALRAGACSSMSGASTAAALSRSDAGPFAIISERAVMVAGVASPDVAARTLRSRSISSSSRPLSMTATRRSPTVPTMRPTSAVSLVMASSASSHALAATASVASTPRLSSPYTAASARTPPRAAKCFELHAAPPSSLRSFVRSKRMALVVASPSSAVRAPEPAAVAAAAVPCATSRATHSSVSSSWAPRDPVPSAPEALAMRASATSLLSACAATARSLAYATVSRSRSSSPLVGSSSSARWQSARASSKRPSCWRADARRMRAFTWEASRRRALLASLAAPAASCTFNRAIARFASRAALGP